MNRIYYMDISAPIQEKSTKPVELPKRMDGLHNLTTVMDAKDQIRSRTSLRSAAGIKKDPAAVSPDLIPLVDYAAGIIPPYNSTK
jgi:hypothetical protein